MKLLMHTCCAPCSVYCIDSLRKENIEPTVYWYNPNIHPYMEYKARRDTLKEYTKSINVEAIFEEEYGLDEFCKNAIGDLKNRCQNYCYKVRLEQTAKFAKEHGFDTISTTLLVSPYQKHEILKEQGEEIAKKYGLNFLYRDFRVGFRKGQNKARELGLYMQKYCGCVFSEEMRYYNRNPIQARATNGYEIPKEPRMQVKKIENKEDYIDLLLEADPSKDMIHRYLNDSDVYALKNFNVIFAPGDKGIIEAGKAYDVALSFSGDFRPGTSGGNAGGGEDKPDEPNIKANVTVTVTPADWTPEPTEKPFE